MLIERSGTAKRHVVIEGTIVPLDHAPVRRLEASTLTTFQWQVLVEFNANSEKVFRRIVKCNYYVKPDDPTKQGSIELISTLQSNERIICFGFASAAKMYTSEKVDISAPLSISVSSFILPDRINALIFALSHYEKTVIDIADDGFATEQRKIKKQATLKRKMATKKPPKSKAKETPKYGFD